MYLTDPKIIKKLTDVSDIVDKYENFIINFSHKPDRNKFPYPKIGSVIDEEKSVKWNREEIERLRSNFDEEVARLNKQCSEIHKAYESALITALTKDYKLPVSTIQKVYGFVLERNSGAKIGDVVLQVHDLLNLHKTLMKDSKPKKTNLTAPIKTLTDIVDTLETYTVGRLKKQQVCINVNDLQSQIDRISDVAKVLEGDTTINLTRR